MRLVVLSKLRTTLDLNCLCSLELNVRKYYGGRYRATSKRGRRKSLHDCCDGEVVVTEGQHFSQSQQCPSFLYPFIHYIYLNIYNVQATLKSPKNINQLHYGSSSGRVKGINHQGLLLQQRQRIMHAQRKGCRIWDSLQRRGATEPRLNTCPFKSLKRVWVAFHVEGRALIGAERGKSVMSGEL